VSRYEAIGFGLVDTPADSGIGQKHAAACGDFLLGLAHKPPRLDFLGSQVDTAYGLKALVADYRVEGRYAEAIERYFVKAANMPALGFYYCCGWDSIGAAGRDGWLQGPRSALRDLNGIWRNAVQPT
jgi:hypothetical protein